MTVEEGGINLPGGPTERTLKDTDTGKHMEVVVPANPDGSLPYKNPAAGYELSDYTDEAGTTQYHGYVRSDGAWFIKRIVTNTDPRTVRFVSGASGYSDAWAARETKSYVTFDAAF